MIEHKETVYISTSEYDRINRLLDIESFYDMTDDEMEEQGVETDYYEGVFYVKFDNESFLTWDLCSGTGNYYDNVVWTSADGKKEEVFDCDYTLGDIIEFEIESEIYIVKVIRV